jgi:hypothetical protein
MARKVCFWQAALQQIKEVAKGSSGPVAVLANSGDFSNTDPSEQPSPHLPSRN